MKETPEVRRAKRGESYEVDACPGSLSQILGMLRLMCSVDSMGSNNVQTVTQPKYVPDAHDKKKCTLTYGAHAQQFLENFAEHLLMACRIL